METVGVSIKKKVTQFQRSNFKIKAIIDVLLSIDQDLVWP
jgi:hypothetical protein